MLNLFIHTIIAVIIVFIQLKNRILELLHNLPKPQNYKLLQFKSQTKSS